MVLTLATDLRITLTSFALHISPCTYRLRFIRATISSCLTLLADNMHLFPLLFAISLPAWRSMAFSVRSLALHRGGTLDVESTVWRTGSRLV